jgi:hypothetical protein
MLSTPGIHSQLRIYRGTEKKDVERFGRRWLLNVTVDTDNQSHGMRFNPVEFSSCFMAAAEAAPRWRSLALVSLPPPDECKDLKIMQPLQQLEALIFAPSCNFGNFLEPLMTAITTTVTPRLTKMEVFHPDASFYLSKPAHLHIFSSLTTLRLICKKMQNPVDILLYLHKLETFEAHHLFLPNYPLSVDLPLTQTLRVLHLKSVSVQWMASQVFPALQKCSIIFPSHADALQFVYMPSCLILKYDSNNLGALEHFHLPHLDRLEVECGQWTNWRGNMQLAALHNIFAAQRLTCLYLEIKCSERLLAHVLRLVPALEELWMGISSPNALGSAFFLAFAAGGRNASVMTRTPSQTTAPLCRALKKLHLHYKRWLRAPERSALIPAFGDIVVSHQPEEQSGFSLGLSFNEGPRDEVWKVHEPVESFDISMEKGKVYIGFSGPHGIVPLSTTSPDNYIYFRPFKELEYNTTNTTLATPIDYFFSFHSLKEVRAPLSALEIEPNKKISHNLPCFHTLKVLYMWSIPASFLAGQTLHELERYGELKNGVDHNPGHGLLTEMPVCTRLVAPLSRLATLKLPQITELSVCFDDEQPHNIWETHITANSNLSGLTLLHLWKVHHYPERPVMGIIKILGSVPALKTLVIDGRCLVVPHVPFFKAFVAADTRGSSRLNQSSWEGQTSRVFCPRLESLQIEYLSLTKHPELMPVLKDIVTLRAMIGSSLKSFTFYVPSYPERKWELIGRDRSFTMEEVVPAQRFQLDI